MIASHHYKRWLLIANAILGVAALATLWLGLLSPVDLPTAAAPSAQIGRMATTTPASGPASRPFAQLEPLLHRNLRTAIFDPPPAAAVAEKPKPQITIQLVGTVVEPGFKRALVRTKASEEKFLSEGESADGGKIVTIADGALTVDWYGEQVTLRVQKDPKQ